MGLVDFHIYLISDRKIIPRSSFWTRLEIILKAGLPIVQLREKDLCDKELYAMAKKARVLTKRYGCKLLINGRWDIAKTVGADGVHLPQDSIPIQVVRQALGTGSLIGKSTHSLASAQKAQREGADFISFGPVFATPSKRIYGPALGLNALRKVCEKLSIPVFALGGIKPNNLRNVLDQGAWGIAVVSAIWKARNPAAATRAFL